MITVEQFWDDMLKDVKRVEDTYIEVPDPDNIGETILVHKDFEEFLDYDSPPINSK